jgi:DNA-binding CsgD family transcriptional regulator
LARPLLRAAAAEDAGNELAPADRFKAVEALNVAFEIYTQCQAVADAQRVGRALRALGAARRIVRQRRAKSGLNSLTESELKVANLVADGATNQAVARRLCISPHTVNTHLRNVFAKLRINSRLEISQVLNGPREHATHSCHGDDVSIRGGMNETVPEKHRQVGRGAATSAAWHTDDKATALLR